MRSGQSARVTMQRFAAINSACTLLRPSLEKADALRAFGRSGNLRSTEVAFYAGKPRDALAQYFLCRNNPSLRRRLWAPPEERTLRHGLGAAARHTIRGARVQGRSGDGAARVIGGRLCPIALWTSPGGPTPSATAVYRVLTVLARRRAAIDTDKLTTR